MKVIIKFNIFFKQLAPTYLEYFLFVFYTALLVIPVYAIVISAINHDWIMMVIDVLLIPIGFLHGLWLLINLF